MDFILKLFATDFMPRSQCGPGWTDGLRGLHVFGDLMTALSYTIIPIVLWVGIRRFVAGRLNTPLLGQHAIGSIRLFIAFILLCGGTHYNDVFVFWIPMYRLFGIWTIFTGIVSMATAIRLVNILFKTTTPKGG